MSPRGFRHSLAPVARLRQWDLDQARQALAEAVAQEQACLAEQQASRAALNEVMASLSASNLTPAIDPAARRQWLAYLHRLDLHCQAAADKVAQAATARATAEDHLLACHKQAKALTVHRDQAWLAYQHEAQIKQCAQADEAWLQASHWKGVQNAYR
jgi:hypothetical protein